MKNIGGNDKCQEILVGNPNVLVGLRVVGGNTEINFTGIYLKSKKIII